MSVRLNIVMDEDLYRRLKKELPPKGISSFINKAVRARIRPDRRTLDKAYSAASREGWRRRMRQEWRSTLGRLNQEELEAVDDALRITLGLP